MTRYWGWGSQPWGEDWGGTLTIIKLKRAGLRRSDFLKLIRDYQITASVYPAYARKDETYDEQENNKVKYNLNPLPVKCYARELSPQSLVYRNYGMEHTGSLEILVDRHYLQWFLICNKVVINGNEYEVFKSGVGQYSSVREGPFSLVALVLTRKSGGYTSFP